MLKKQQPICQPYPILSSQNYLTVQLRHSNLVTLRFAVITYLRHLLISSDWLRLFLSFSKLYNLTNLLRCFTNPWDIFHMLIWVKVHRKHLKSRERFKIRLGRSQDKHSVCRIQHKRVCNSAGRPFAARGNTMCATAAGCRNQSQLEEKAFSADVCSAVNNKKVVQF